jgi:hypothetical protein
LSCPGSPQNSPRKEFSDTPELGAGQSVGSQQSGSSIPSSFGGHIGTGGTRAQAQSYSPSILQPAFCNDTGKQGPSDEAFLGSSPLDAGVKFFGGPQFSYKTRDLDAGISPPFPNGPMQLLSTSPPVGGPSMSQLREGLVRRQSNDKVCSVSRFHSAKYAG